VSVDHCSNHLLRRAWDLRKCSCGGRSCVFLIYVDEFSVCDRSCYSVVMFRSADACSS
jgi:hypothetical protein